MELFINGRKMDLPEDFAVSKTLQVNDIGSLNTREASFTSKIKLPLTSNNRVALDFLGSNGNQSIVPYQRSVATILDNTGESLVYNGWADIDKTKANGYEFTIYDGIVEFYKTIENKNLTDIGLSELNHLKNLETVTESFTANTPYRYIISDFNGKTTFTPTGSTSGYTYLNADYLVPSAHVPFIWDKIFQFANYTYEGQVFETEAFQNLWMTYPKPVPTTDQAVVHINTQTFTLPLTYIQQFPTSDFAGVFYGTVYESTLIQDCFTTSGASTQTQTDGHCRYITVNQDGLYRFVLDGEVDFPNFPNAQYSIALMRSNMVTGTHSYENIMDNLPLHAVFDNVPFSFAMTEDERVGLHFMRNGIPFSTNSYWNPGIYVEGDLDISFYQVLGDVVNFDAALIEFKIKDFVNEIMQRFCLTMYKHKYEDKITFLTLDELLTTTNVERWEEDIEIVEEDYAYGDYAQRNLFKYRYNRDNDTTHDGAISISNPNLKDENTVISSAFYAPDGRRALLGRYFNIYPFWSREVKTENNETTVDYRPLDKRFYLLRCENHTFPSSVYRIGSELFGVWQEITALPVESYYRLPMRDIITDYYSSMSGILNRSKVITVNKHYSSKDIVDFDFRKLIYIDKLGEYFIPNKVADWIEGRATRTELVNVKFFSTQEGIDNGGVIPIDPLSELEITNITQSGCSITVEFTTDAEYPFILNLMGVVPIFGGQPVGGPYWVESGNSIEFDISGLGGPYIFSLSINQVGIVANSPNYPFFIISC